VSLTIEEKCRIAWPETNLKAIIAVGPMGSRQDYLLFNRETNEVTTGNIGKDRPCWFSSLDAFAERVEKSYGERLESAQYSEEGKANLVRYRAEYRQVITFLRSLPSYKVVADEPVAYA